MLSIKIITSCPEMFPGVLGYSVVGKALKEGKWLVLTRTVAPIFADLATSAAAIAAISDD